jgi:1,4-dihydroxy-2-naphthoyl-CoA hydrolase
MSFSYFRTVHFRDTDAAGVVYFANVLAICHEAYEASLIVAGVDMRSFFSTRAAIAVPIIHAEVDFMTPIHCGDRLRVELLPQSLTQDRFEIHYQIFGEAVPEALLGKAMTRHQCIQPTTRQRHPLSPELTHWLQQWEA